MSAPFNAPGGHEHGRASWASIASRLVWRTTKRLFNRQVETQAVTAPRVIVYAAFKGMGDLLCAVPVIQSQLNSGRLVIVLIFPQIRSLLELVDFGPNQKALRICILPVSRKLSSIRAFLREISTLSPDLVWYSPHAPLVVSSWKIPLLLWIVKTRYWPTAKLAGADTEKFSWLFDSRVQVDRRLPYGLREWTAFSMLNTLPVPVEPPRASFKPPLQQYRLLALKYDIVIHPGAGAENRKWTYPHYGELMGFIPANYRIAIVGLPGDIAAMRAILPANRNIQYLSGSLEEAIASIAQARVALTMDSGTMFFAKILGVPMVTLFGPSNPATVARPDAKAIQLYEQKWPCQPCGNNRCTQKSVLCMDAIEPAKVGKELLLLLESNP